MADTPPPTIPPRKKTVKETQKDVYQFTTKGKGYTMPEFFELFSNKLPIFAIATEGNLGCTEFETFSAEQTLFCRSYTRQRRVVARDAKNRTISIPDDYPLKFKVVKSSSRVGKEQSLAEILSENKLPLQVQFSVPGDVDLLIDADKRRVKDLTNLVLVKTYEETFILAHGVYGETVTPEPMIVPLYLKDLEVGIVNGVIGMSDEEWDILYMDLKSQLKDAHRAKTMGNREIALYSDTLSTDGDSDDNIYEFLEPTEYISFAHLSGESTTDDDKYTTPYFHRRQGTKALVSELERNLKLNIGDPSKMQQGRKSMKTSFSETSRHHEPPKLPPRTQSYIERSKRKLEDPSTSIYVEVGEATPSRTSGDTQQRETGIDLSNTTINEFSNILKQLRLTKYVDKFKKLQVSGEIAKDLTEDILMEEFHMTKFEILKFTKFIKTGHISK